MDDKDKPEDKSGMSIAGALERRHGAPQEHNPPQGEKGTSDDKPSSAPPMRYRNRAYRESWEQLYLLGGMSQEEAAILSRVCDLIRPGPYYDGEGMHPVGTVSKPRFLEFLDYTEVDDPDYRFVVERGLTDEIDISDPRTRIKLGITPETVAQVNRSMCPYCATNITVPSPHMLAAVMPDGLAAVYLSVLGSTAFEPANFHYDYNVSNVSKKNFDALRKHLYGLTTPGAQRKLIESGADSDSCAINIKSIDEYLRKIESHDSRDGSDAFLALSREFYGFKWGQW